VTALLVHGVERRIQVAAPPKDILPLLVNFGQSVPEKLFKLVPTICIL
jgi:hypothetical protein